MPLSGLPNHISYLKAFLPSFSFPPPSLLLPLLFLPRLPTQRGNLSYTSTTLKGMQGLRPAPLNMIASQCEALRARIEVPCSPEGLSPPEAHAN